MTAREIALFGLAVLGLAAPAVRAAPVAAPIRIGIIGAGRMGGTLANLESEAHRPGEAVAIPLAGDDAEALGVAQQLVKDAGFVSGP